MTLLPFISGALQHNYGDVRAVVGENATAGIFATYPTEGISTVSIFMQLLEKAKNDLQSEQMRKSRQIKEN